MSLNPNTQYSREDALQVLKFTYFVPAAEAARAVNEAYNEGECPLQAHKLKVSYLHSAMMYLIRPL